MGQYEDPDLGGVYYNRFRYYDSLAGVYMSQDPIGLHGGANLYGYVHDSNRWTDVFGLSSIVVIGEGQKAVDEATRLLRSQGYNAESMMVPKNQWRGGDLSPGMPEAKFQEAVDWNKQWLKDKLANGYKVVDIGTDGRAVRSPFYQAEQEAIKEMRTPKIKLKKFANGETIGEMRVKVLCCR